MAKITFLISVFFHLLILQYAYSAPPPSINTSAIPSCTKYNTSTTYSISINNPPSAANTTYSYDWSYSTDGGLNYANFPTFTTTGTTNSVSLAFTSTTVLRFRVTITANPFATSTIFSPDETVEVPPSSSPITSVASLQPIVPLISTDTPYDLNALLNQGTFTGEIDYSIRTIASTGPIFYNYNTGSPLAAGDLFRPSSTSPPYPKDYEIAYRVYSTGSSCKSDWIYSNTTIRVYDGSGALPYFIKPISAVPICESVNTNFQFEILSSCTSILNISATADYSNPTANNVNLPLTFSGYDPFTGSARYRTSVNPKRYNKASSSIPITVTIGGSCVPGPFSIPQKLDGFIPIVAKSKKDTIIGLPPPVSTIPAANGTYNVNICSASLDTIFMQGFPSGGYYSIFKATGPTPTTWTLLDTPDPLYDDELLGSNLFPTYITNAPDQSLQKIIPAELFSNVNYGNSDINTVFKVLYISSKLASGACADTFDIRLSFVDANATNYTIVSPAPAKTTPLTYCYGDTMKLQINPAIASNYTWFNSEGLSQQVNSSTLNYSFVFNNPGEHFIRLKSIPILASAQCGNDTSIQFLVGAKPKANFDVFNNSLNNPATNFKSTAQLTKPNTSITNPPNPASSTDVINGWEWSWGELPSPAFVSSAPSNTIIKTYNALQREPYKVYHVATSGWGCTDTLIRNIPIFAVKTPLATDRIVEDFNTPTAAIGWFESGQYLQKNTTQSSWDNITPTKNIIKSTDPCWITVKAKAINNDTSGYYNNEFSYVESPCYSLSQLSLPMVSFNTWVQSDNLFDGATLQYTLCDSAFGKEKWYTIGKLNSGLEWFNSKTIISSPGGKPASGANLLGWTGTDNQKGWKLSAYGINNIKDTLSLPKHSAVEYIRFRVAFASNGDNTPDAIFDGFAFDNFFVGQRNRKVLIEEFCDYKNYEAAFAQTPFINNSQALRIQYHSRYMNLDDVLNNQNIGENGARTLLYGQSTLPRAAVDGYYANDQENPFFGFEGERKFEQRTLEVSPFRIGITLDTSDAMSGNLNMRVDYTKLASTPNDTRMAYLAEVVVAEKKVTGNNGLEFTNVFRKFLPHPAGQRIEKATWAINNTQSLDRSFTPFTSLTPGNDNDTSLVVIAFIQDEVTYEVYQAEAAYVHYKHAKKLSQEPLPKRLDAAAGASTFALYPNPTAGTINVLFADGLSAPEDYRYEVIDSYGKVVLQGTITKGTSETQILGSETLISGLYRLQLTGSSTEAKSFTKVK